MSSSLVSSRLHVTSFYPFLANLNFDSCGVWYLVNLFKKSFNNLQLPTFHSFFARHQGHLLFFLWWSLFNHLVFIAFLVAFLVFVLKKKAIQLGDRKLQVWQVVIVHSRNISSAYLSQECVRLGKNAAKIVSCVLDRLSQLSPLSLCVFDLSVCNKISLE